VTTVRSEDKAAKIRAAHNTNKLEFAIVPDIAVEGAFDEVVKTPGLEVVMHTASPFHFNWSMSLSSFPGSPIPVCWAAFRFPDGYSHDWKETQPKYGMR
jgi:hypothetical protein